MLSATCALLFGSPAVASSSIPAPWVEKVAELIVDGDYQRAIDVGEASLEDQTAHGAMPDELVDGWQVLARAHRYGGDQDEAQRLQRKAVAFLVSELGDNHPRTAVAKVVLAEILYGAVKLADAEELARGALAILEIDDPRSPETADAASVLGDIMYSRKIGDEALALYMQALKIRKAALPPTDPRIASALNDIGIVYSNRWQLDLGTQYYREALAINRAAHGDKHPNVSTRLLNIGVNLDRMGRYREAEQVFLEALSIREDVFGEHFRTANVLGMLGQLYRRMGRFDEAEPLLLRALAIRETMAGVNHPGIAIPLSMLGSLYLDTGRIDEAIGVLERSLEIRSAHFEAPHSSINRARNNLAMAYLGAGRNSEASDLLRTALEDQRQLDGGATFDTASRHEGVGVAALAERRFPAAAAQFQQALDIYQRNPESAASADVADALLGLSRAQFFQGEPAATEASLRRAINLYEQNLGDQTKGAAKARILLARSYAELNRMDDAYRVGIAALDSLDETIVNSLAVNASQSLHQQVSLSDELTALSRVFARIVTEACVKKPEAIDAAFRSAQLAKVSALSNVAKQASIIAGSVGAEGELARGRRDLQFQYDRAVRSFVRLSANGSDGAASYQNQARELDAEIKKLTTKLKASAPKLSDMMTTPSISIATLQGMALKPLQSRGILFISQAKDDALIFFISDNHASLTLAPIGLEEAAALSGRIRDSVDISDALFLSELPAFDSEASEQLYDIFIAPFEANISDVNSLYVVADGPVSRIPFSLFSSAPEEGDKPRRWLIDDVSVSYLPSVSSLPAMASVRERERVSARFLGIGDPALSGEVRVASASAFAALRSQIQSGPNGAKLNTAALCELSPLPDTRRELRTMSEIFQLSSRKLLLAKEASEENLRALNDDGALAGYDVIAFATHAILPDAAKTDGEAALVLSPPAKCVASDPRNDGLLTASEIMQLTLDADWVILSACNTAAASGADAEPFSGIAKAFFYAGARSVLATHWDVSSDATSTFMQSVFHHINNGVDRSEAIRLAQLSFRDAPPSDKLFFAHPAFWAPFAYVGVSGTSHP